MKSFLKTVQVQTTADTDVIDLTELIGAAVGSTEIDAGLAVISIPGSTAAVTTIEFEAGAVEDLKRAIERLVPRDQTYAHDARWGDGNGYAHVRAALMGPSLSLPIRGKKLLRGTWQQVVLVDFDNRPRQRDITLQILGA